MGSFLVRKAFKRRHLLFQFRILFNFLPLRRMALKKLLLARWQENQDEKRKEDRRGLHDIIKKISTPPIKLYRVGDNKWTRKKPKNTVQYINV